MGDQKKGIRTLILRQGQTIGDPQIVTFFRAGTTPFLQICLPQPGRHRAAQQASPQQGPGTWHHQTAHSFDYCLHPASCLNRSLAHLFPFWDCSQSAVRQSKINYKIIGQRHSHAQASSCHFSHTCGSKSNDTSRYHAGQDDLGSSRSAACGSRKTSEDLFSPTPRAHSDSLNDPDGPWTDTMFRLPGPPSCFASPLALHAIGSPVDDMSKSPVRLFIWPVDSKFASPATHRLSTPLRLRTLGAFFRVPESSSGAHPFSCIISCIISCISCTDAQTR